VGAAGAAAVVVGVGDSIVGAAGDCGLLTEFALVGAAGW